MPFTDKDREKLIQVHTDVAWIKKEHGARLDNLEKADRVLHHRINKTRNLLIGLSTTISAAVGGVGAWLKSQIGVQ